MTENTEKPAEPATPAVVAVVSPSQLPLKVRLKNAFQTKKSPLTVLGAAIILSTYSIKEV